MLSFIAPTALLAPQLGNPSDRPAPTEQPHREALRHLIIGSPTGVRSAIHQLHALHYADSGQWSQLITITPSGILITPRQGEVLSFLLRHRQLN